MLDMDGDHAFIGIGEFWEGEQPFGIDASDCGQHIYCVGKTGTGKSTLLRNLILQDLHAGNGVALIDPHGDLAKDVLEHYPTWRSDDLVVFDPSDREFPVGLNLLKRSGNNDHHIVASAIVSAFKAVWHDSWGPRLEYLLFASAAALSECQNVSVLGIGRMLADAGYRDWVVRQVKDPMVRAFWEREFAGYGKRFVSEIVAPLQNKVGQLTMAPPIRNILGQVCGKLDFRFMLDHGRVFIGSLSKGQLGDDKAHLLGAFIMSQFHTAAMSRSDQPVNERRPFHLYVDEFSSFATDTLSSMLSESRKYGLCLTLGQQHTSQLRPELRDALFGNVGTIISFRVGETDAQLLSREFGGHFAASRFTDLNNYQVLVKAVSGGKSRAPFAGRTFPPMTFPNADRSKLIDRSRERFATPRRVVEDRIQRWSSRSLAS
jgi:hypothetical protein